MKLSEKECATCSIGAVAFDRATSEKYLVQLNKWRLSEDSKWIYKEFSFSNFLEALEFVKKIAVIAEEQHHHPNINFTWGYCKISIQTHKINGLCESDFVLAAKIDQIS